MNRQELRQKQVQKLTPQQIQFLKLLQVSVAQLDARVKQELEENPALEDAHFSQGVEEDSEAPDPENEPDIHEEDPFESTDSQQELESYLDNEDFSQVGSWSGDEEDRPDPLNQIMTSSGFREQLLDQWHLMDLDDRQYQIGEQIIGSLDDDGYLRRSVPALVDDLAFSQSLIVEEPEVEQALKKVQTLDPPGIAARSLQECLLLQVDRKIRDPKHQQWAKEILEQHFEEFTRKHYQRMEKALGITRNQLAGVMEQITHLNPKPGGALGGEVSGQTIIPDFILRRVDGELQLRLNAKNAPELKVSREYRNLLETYKEQKTAPASVKEAARFVKQKLDGAQWFIDAIRQRQQTLLKVMAAILEFQPEYFKEGDLSRLRPMLLKDIAAIVDMDISTVSRVVNSKYIQTDFGIFRLKEFFSEGFERDQGDEVTSRAIKEILAELMAAEDKRKPLPDDALARALQKRGYPVARRTVAKYREQMGAPVARLRREVQ